MIVLFVWLSLNAVFKSVSVFLCFSNSSLSLWLPDAHSIWILNLFVSFAFFFFILFCFECQWKMKAFLVLLIVLLALPAFAGKRRMLTKHDVCRDKVCTLPNNQCYDKAECKKLGDQGVCVYTPSAAGTACDDGDDATCGDQCDGDGNCKGKGLSSLDLSLPPSPSSFSLPLYFLASSFDACCLPLLHFLLVVCLCLIVWWCAAGCGELPTPENAYEPECAGKGVSIHLKQFQLKCDNETGNCTEHLEGTKCGFHCRPDFTPTRDDLYVLCQGDGTWLIHGGCIRESCNASLCGNFTRVCIPSPPLSSLAFFFSFISAVKTFFRSLRDAFPWFFVLFLFFPLFFLCILPLRSLFLLYSWSVLFFLVVPCSQRNGKCNGLLLCSDRRRRGVLWPFERWLPEKLWILEGLRRWRCVHHQHLLPQRRRRVRPSLPFACRSRRRWNGPGSGHGRMEWIQLMVWLRTYWIAEYETYGTPQEILQQQRPLLSFSHSHPRFLLGSSLSPGVVFLLGLIVMFRRHFFNYYSTSFFFFVCLWSFCSAWSWCSGAISSTITAPPFSFLCVWAFLDLILVLVPAFWTRAFIEIWQPLWPLPNLFHLRDSERQKGGHKVKGRSSKSTTNWKTMDPAATANLWTLRCLFRFSCLRNMMMFKRKKHDAGMSHSNKQKARMMIMVRMRKMLANMKRIMMFLQFQDASPTPNRRKQMEVSKRSEAANDDNNDHERGGSAIRESIMSLWFHDAAQTLNRSWFGTAVLLPLVLSSTNPSRQDLQEATKNERKRKKGKDRKGSSQTTRCKGKKATKRNPEASGRQGRRWAVMLFLPPSLPLEDTVDEWEQSNSTIPPARREKA